MKLYLSIILSCCIEEACMFVEYVNGTFLVGFNDGTSRKSKQKLCEICCICC